MQIKRILTLTVLVVSAWMTSAVGQPTSRFFQCDTAEAVILDKGTRFVLDNCDWGAIFNDAAMRKMLGQEIKQENAIQILQRRVELGTQISLLQDSVIARYRHIDSVQSASYAMLHKDFERSDALILRATDNTDRALSYIRRVKFSGYVSSSVLGGISGGVLGGQLQSGGNQPVRFSWPGALVGAAGGCLIYWFIMDVIN